MRVAVVDIGSNSTRLLIADAADGSVTELERRSVVTRLGEGVDAGGRLGEAPQGRVFAALDQFAAAIEAHRVTRRTAVLTSAVRDAANGQEFADAVRDRYDLAGRTLTGDEEARLTYLGVTAGGRRDEDVPRVVIDIGGGSTEFVIGLGRTAGFHVSLPAGVVRMSERHIHSDPPAPEELQELARDVHTIFLEGLPADERTGVELGIAVAGTATSAAAMAQELDPYDPDRVHGYRLMLATVELLLARLADMTEAERRQVVGLHPDRAPTIVAGMILLAEAMRAFQLDEVEVSEHDILYGGALRLAGLG